MTSPRTQARSIFDASPRAARRAWIVNGILLASGGSAATLVYLLCPGSEEIVRVGQAGAESVESRLFSPPFFQLVFFLMPLMIDLNWRRFQSVVHHSEQLQRERDARFQQLDTVLLYFAMCFMLVVFEIILFVLTLSAAWWVYARSSLHAG
jgi:hypothetical protein